MKFTVDKALHTKAFLIAIIIGFIFFEYITDILIAYQTDLFRYSHSILLYWAVLLGIVLAMSFVHELIHGLGHLIFGGKVKIGFKGIYAYTKEVSGMPIYGKHLLIILLMPVIIISIPAIFLSHWIFQFLCIFNFIGSLGDILMFIFIVKNKGYRRYIRDLEDGFIIN